MTTITIDRELLEQALEALEIATDNYDDSAIGIEVEAIQTLRAALSAPATAPAQPDQAFVCSLGCTTECLARQHGVPSECPSLPRQPVITPATAQAAEIARLRSESEERLQNCAALVAEVERLRKDAERKPITDEDTLALFNRIQTGMRFTDADIRPFAAGVTAAEFFHKIKGTP